MNQRYVLGFAFCALTPTDLRAVLIRKNRPSWQRGMINGLGGKIEDQDWHKIGFDHPVTGTGSQVHEVRAATFAMEREFQEEAGLQVPPQRWQWFKTEAWADTGAVMECFGTLLIRDELAMIDPGRTDEPLVIRQLQVTPDWHVLNVEQAYSECLYNLPYLIQNALIHLKVGAYGKCIKV